MGLLFGVEQLVEMSVPRIRVRAADRFDLLFGQLDRGEAAAAFAEALAAEAAASSSGIGGFFGAIRSIAAGIKNLF
jgi:hypothetical protein